jgi:hypothetical protein
MVINDFRKVHRELYTMKKNVIEVLDVPNLIFAIAEGEGVRDIYHMHKSDALWSLSRVTNRLKDMTKQRLNYQFKLMPLEIIWSEKQGKQDVGTQVEWKWTAMMQLPDIIDGSMFDEAIAELEKRKRSVKVPVKFESVEQGLCAQVLHMGDYHRVDQTLQTLHSHLDEKGYRPRGNRREIYINQPFCNPPDKLKTIVRLPIEQCT